MAIVNAPPHAVSSAGGAGHTCAAAPTAARGSLLVSCGAWLRRRIDAARLRELDPHLARDIGITPASDGRPEGFAVDPRRVWSIGLIGLAPRPMDGTGRAARRHR